MCECFARVGEQIAKTVTGQLGVDDVIRLDQLKSAFTAALSGQTLSGEAVQSLEARCMGFLKSTDPDDQKLKLYLTQSFYFAQLLGLENASFNPITEQAFTGAVFYLDTNVILPGMLGSDQNALLFNEMVGVARRLGMELRVTRATIDEARGVAADRRLQLETVVRDIPPQLSALSRDQFLTGFLEARERDPNLTAEQYLEPFERTSEVLAGLGIVIDDRTADEILARREAKREVELIQAEAVRLRGWGKNEAVLRHDVAHCVLVQDERNGNSRTWFLRAIVR